MFCFFLGKLLTKASKTVNPTRDRSSCQLNTDIIAKVITVLCNEMVSVSAVLFSKLLHKGADFLRIQICSSNQNRLPERETWTLLRFHLEDPRCRMLVCSETVLNPMNYIFLDRTYLMSLLFIKSHIKTEHKSKSFQIWNLMTPVNFNYYKQTNIKET